MQHFVEVKFVDPSPLGISFNERAGCAAAARTRLARRVDQACPFAAATVAPCCWHHWHAPQRLCTGRRYGNKRGEKWLVVAGILRDTQADKFHIMARDLVVVSVQGKPVIGAPTAEVMAMLRARPLTMGFLPLEHAPYAEELLLERSAAPAESAGWQGSLSRAELGAELSLTGTQLRDAYLARDKAQAAAQLLQAELSSLEGALHEEKARRAPPPRPRAPVACAHAAHAAKCPVPPWGPPFASRAVLADAHGAVLCPAQTLHETVRDEVVAGAHESVSGLTSEVRARALPSF